MEDKQDSEDEQVPEDLHYPRGDEVGLPSSKNATHDYPHDIDWKTIVVKPLEASSLMGKSMRWFSLSFMDKTRPELFRVAKAIRDCILRSIPNVCVDNCQDMGTNTSLELTELCAKIGQVPVLACDANELQEHKYNQPFTQYNSYKFKLAVKYDVNRAELPAVYRIAVQKETLARQEIERTFGVLNTESLHRVPDFLRPVAPCALESDAHPPPLKLTTPQVLQMTVFSHDATWIPMGNQREQWIRKLGLTECSAEEQARLLNKHGPRLQPNIPLVTIVEDEQVNMIIRCTNKTGLDKAHRLAGALPSYRYPQEIHGCENVTGQKALDIARMCPSQCFQLTDVEDLGLLVSATSSPEHYAKHVSKAKLQVRDARFCQGVESCGKCCDASLSIDVRDKKDEILFRVESHSRYTPDTLMTKALELLATTYAVFQPPDDDEEHVYS